MLLHIASHRVASRSVVGLGRALMHLYQCTVNTSASPTQVHCQRARSIACLSRYTFLGPSTKRDLMITSNPSGVGSDIQYPYLYEYSVKRLLGLDFDAGTAESCDAGTSYKGTRPVLCARKSDFTARAPCWALRSVLWALH